MVRWTDNGQEGTSIMEPGEIGTEPTDDDGTESAGRGEKAATTQAVPSARLTHPGQVVAEGMTARGLNASTLATELGCPTAELEGVLAEERRLTPDLAVALARAWDGDAEFWLRLQAEYDWLIAERARG